MNDICRSHPPHPLTDGPAASQLIRVLVVDDHRDTADSLAILLRLTGYEVAIAYGGPEAVVAASAFRPDVAILDLGMPRLDGFAVAAWLRRQGAAQDIILVAVTGFGGAETCRQAFAAGFNHFFLKPLDFWELNRVIADGSRKTTSARAV